MANNRRKTTVATGIALAIAGAGLGAHSLLHQQAHPPVASIDRGEVPQPAVRQDPQWAAVNPNAALLRAAATSFAGRFAEQWWAYDAGRAKAGNNVANDLIARVSPFLDQRALTQAADLGISGQSWQQIVADQQRATPYDLHAFVPELWEQAIGGPGADKIPYGTVMVTVTGTTRIIWSGGTYINHDVALTVDVICRPPNARASKPSCVIDYIFPRVAR